MAVWTDTSQNSASWTNVPSRDFLTAGSPIGLLLALTYSGTQTINSWTDVTENSSSWSNVSQN